MRSPVCSTRLFGAVVPTIAITLLLTISHAAALPVCPDSVQDGALDFTRTHLHNGVPFSQVLGEARDKNGLKTLLDFDGDKAGDAAALRSDTGEVYVFTRYANGSFQGLQRAAFSAKAARLIAGDLDNNGRADLVAVLEDNRIGIIFVESDGKLSTPRYLSAAPNQIGGIALADFNRNGTIDMALADVEGILSYQMPGTRNLPPTTPWKRHSLIFAWIFPNPYGLEVTYPDASGKPALLILNAYDSMLTEAVMTLHNQSSLSSISFNYRDDRADFFSFNGSSVAAAAAGNLDADAYQDAVILANDTPSLEILKGTGGKQTHAASYSLGSSGGLSYRTGVALADFDLAAAPTLDIAVPVGGENKVYLLTNRGGIFGNALKVAAGAGPQSIAAGDFDRDGDQDLIVANSGQLNLEREGLSILSNKRKYVPSPCPSPAPFSAAR